MSATNSNKLSHALIHCCKNCPTRYVSWWHTKVAMQQLTLQVRTSLTFQFVFVAGRRFHNNRAFQGIGLSSWDVGKVNNMQNMFYYNTVFNGDLSNWDVSSVTSMYQTVSCRLSNDTASISSHCWSNLLHLCTTPVLFGSSF